MQTTMSSSLPPEILDLIVDHLHDEPTALKACCVVSKSWIQRTRTHLFASVEFCSPAPPIELWKKSFPDPSSSPAHYARHLSIHNIRDIAAADADWIHPFHNIVYLHLRSQGWVGHRIFRGPFCGLSPTLRSLHLSSTSPDVLDFICSFPLLEDLAWDFLGEGGEPWDTPSTSPKLTGSLDLSGVIGGTHPAVRRLLSLPNGLHFVKIMVTCLSEDVEATTDLVLSCSDNLESLEVSFYSLGTFPSVSVSGRRLTTGSRGSSHA
jgi:hypothetical protein